MIGKVELATRTSQWRRFRAAMLLTTFGVGLSLISAPRNASAACVITQPSQFLFTCAANTTTTSGFNVIAPGSTSAANQSSFLTGVDVVINPGVLINGNGLSFGIISPSLSTVTNNGAATATGTSANGLRFVNSGAGGTLRYVGNGSASSLSGAGLSLVAVTVQFGTSTTPIVPNYSGPSSNISPGGLSITGFSKAEAYLSGGTIAGGMGFGQASSGQPAILTLANHTTITADATSRAIYTFGPVVLTSDANIGDADHRVGTGISAHSFGAATSATGLLIDVIQKPDSSIFANTFGIYAENLDAPGAVRVTTNGAISLASGSSTGVMAAGIGDVIVNHQGLITSAPGNSGHLGIYARSYTAGNISVSVSGDISLTSDASSVGLAATATSGNITIDIAPGAIIKAGSVGILAASNTGTTTINNLGTVSGVIAANFIGTMNVGNGGTTGTIIGNVVDRGTLNFNRSDAVTYGGIISDTGRVQQNGSGSLTFTGINTYTGATNVNAGTLSVNGSIASSSLTTVNAGGTLGGNGTIGNTTINGGTLAPGNSIGTLTVQGNLVFTTRRATW